MDAGDVHSLHGEPEVLMNVKAVTRGQQREGGEGRGMLCDGDDGDDGESRLLHDDGGATVVVYLTP